MKVVSNLSRLGYIEAQRGPGGGICLARPASEIILAEVICDMEEDLNMAECFSPTGRCTISPVCRLQGFLRKALQAYLDTLEAITLEELLHPTKELQKLLDIRHQAA
jgi:Rrf2 family nitric oxide-sensitive transcriptional repressor